MEVLFSRLTHREVPEFRQTIDLFEQCGQLRHDEAEEWRRRLSEWTDFLFGADEPGETGSMY
jgi:hypothetical protein